jgi:hypothetical protein
MYRQEKESSAILIKDLFGNDRFLKDGKVVNERAGLIGHFQRRARDKRGNRFHPAYIGLILAHLKIEDLYYLKSVLADRERTLPNFNWNKTFFGMIKTEKESSD